MGNENSTMKYHVYHALVILAGKTRQVDLVYTDMDTLKSQFTGCPPSNQQWQELYKLLHEVLRSCKKSESASQVMIELLDTYTTENASQAREETHKCIVAHCRSQCISSGSLATIKTRQILGR